MDQEGMFWKLVREDVIGEPAECTSAWTESEWGPRTLQLREYLMREFWAIFLDDRPFHCGSLYWHANVQPKTVFSCSMTVMDKIHGWEDEEKWMGSKFAACMWIYTKSAQTGGQILDRVQEEYVRKRKMSMMLCANWICEGAFVDHEWVSSRTIIQQEAETRTRNAGVPYRRMLSIMQCVNWVCAGTFGDNEWVSESTIVEHEEEVIGRDLDYETCIPYVVQWSMAHG